MIKYIEGGVCAAQGFKAAGVHCGIRSKNTEKKDLALIVSDVMCSAAAVYTKNKVFRPKCSHRLADWRCDGRKYTKAFNRLKFGGKSFDSFRS